MYIYNPLLPSPSSIARCIGGGIQGIILVCVCTSKHSNLLEQAQCFARSDITNQIPTVIQLEFGYDPTEIRSDCDWILTGLR